MNMEDMMKQCCGEGGMPDAEKMKAFMEICGKKDFSQEEMELMKNFCCREGKPNPKEMAALMEKCGCQMPSKDSA